MQGKGLFFFIATGAYSGLAPVAPGTFGSIAFLLLWLALAFILHGTQLFSLFPLMLFLSTTILGTIASRSVIRNQTLKDPQFIVIDEWAGLALCLLFGDTGTGIVWQSMLALCLFRIFDITKIFPISRFEQLPGAFGVMADDLVAGALAGLLLYGLNCLM